MHLVFLTPDSEMRMPDATCRLLLVAINLTVNYNEPYLVGQMLLEQIPLPLP